MIKFSIICPTRFRPAIFQTFIQHFATRTYDLDSIEVLSIMDEDAIYSEIPSYSWHRLLISKRFNKMSEYYNFATQQAKGEWLFICNDDSHILTHNWDTIASEELKSFHGIGLGFTIDNMRTMPHSPRDRCRQKSYCEFPIIGKKGARKLGWTMPPYFPAWGADRYICEVYEKAGRIKKIPIELRHLRIMDDSRHHMQHLNGPSEPSVCSNADAQKIRMAANMSIPLL